MHLQGAQKDYFVIRSIERLMPLIALKSHVTSTSRDTSETEAIVHCSFFFCPRY